MLILAAVFTWEFSLQNLLMVCVKSRDLQAPVNAPYTSIRKSQQTESSPEKFKCTVCILYSVSCKVTCVDKVSNHESHFRLPVIPL
jgi:hypothetical protein